MATINRIACLRGFLAVVAWTGLLVARVRADSFVADSSDEAIWLVASRSDPLHGDAILFSLLDKRGEFAIPRESKLQVGRIQWTAVRGKRLHVIYDDGEHKAYDPGVRVFEEIPPEKQ